MILNGRIRLLRRESGGSDSGVEAIKKFTDSKNIELFEKMGVFTPRECEARRAILLDHYIGTVEMEALTMIDMINQHVIPSCKKAELGFVKKLEDATYLENPH